MSKRSTIKRGLEETATSRKRKKNSRKRADADGILTTEEDISKYAELARQLVLAAWPDIVHGLIEKAASGGYQQAKLLFDVCNLNDPDAGIASEAKRRQLCDVLLEGLSQTLTSVEKKA